MSGSDYNCIYIVPLCFNGRLLVIMAGHMLISARQFMPHMRRHTVSNRWAVDSTASLTSHAWTKQFQTVTVPTAGASGIY